MIVIAVDPGKVTGYVVVNSMGLTVYEHHEVDDWFSVGVMLESDLQYYGEERGEDVRVVIERFVINAGTAKKSVQEEPRDIIGAVKYLTKKHTGIAAKQQNAAEAKTFSTNEKLKKVGFWHVGGAGHANDAFRHAMVYMVNHDALDPQLLLDSEAE